jgi:hypothetical protein
LSRFTSLRGGLRRKENPFLILSQRLPLQRAERASGRASLRPSGSVWVETQTDGLSSRLRRLDYRDYCSVVDA